VPLLEQVLEKNPDTVKIVFKNMPLRFHKFAEPSARAALAAHKQGKFWEFHDKLFGVEKLSDEVINNVAVELQLDMDQFTKDMNSPEIRQMVNKDLLDAQKAGVTGTPTIFINGKKLKNRSLAGFQAMIDKELKGS
jgi:protein-disulfide isomerase